MNRIIVKPGEKPPAEGQDTATSAPATSSEESSPTASPVDEKGSEPPSAGLELASALPISVASEQRTAP